MENNNYQMTDKELAKFEKYKKQANKRADKHIAKELKRKDRVENRAEYFKKSIIFSCKIVLIISIIIFIASFLTLFIMKTDKTVSIIAIIISSMFGFFAYCYLCQLNKKTAESILAEDREANEINDKLAKVYYPEELDVCPICGKTHIHIKYKKFSKTKAIIGLALTKRLYGALCGVPTNKHIKARCPDCGNTFTVLND